MTMRTVLFSLALVAFAVRDGESFQNGIDCLRSNDLWATSTLIRRHAVNGERSSPSDESTNFNYIGLNTNRNAPYIPSGLKPEQYEQIKRTEAAKLAKMNFGAWGPRFKRQAAAPSGDWMVQTNLWVRGFQAPPSSPSSPLSKEDIARFDRRQRYWNGFKMALPSFLLGYAIVDLLILPFTTVQAASSTKKLTSVLLAMIQALPRNFLSNFLVFSKLQLLHVILAGMAMPLINQYREIAQRRWLWSKRRTFGTPILVAVVMAVVNLGLCDLLLR